MIEFEIEQLRRLPQRASDTWQGGWCRLPFHADIGGRDGLDGRLGIWASLETGLVNESGEVCWVEEIDAARLVTLLVRFAINRRLAGYRPGRVQVCDQALAEALRPSLARADIAVELAPGLTERLPAIVPVLAAMRQEVADGDTGAAIVEVPGMTIGRLRAFADAAREFCLARPWERIEGDDDPVRILAPAPGPGREVVCVFGADGEFFGLRFFASLDRFAACLREEDDDRMRALMNVDEGWSVEFGTSADLPYEDAEAWRQHDLPVAGEAAYPLVFRVRPPGEFLAPGPADLTFIEGLLRAFARGADAQLDSGRWTVTVPTHDGARDYALELPELLAPPSREELRARGHAPDPRSLERIQNQHFIGRPIDQLPFAPRDAWERAQEICYRAFAAVGRRRLVLAREALAVCPDCADAHMILSEAVFDLEQRLAHLTAGAAAGARALDGERRREFSGELWGLMRARGWLRALHARAAVLRRLGRLDEAIASAQELLHHDRDDHQGVRALLLLLLFETARDAELSDLFARYPDNVTQDHGVWAWARALHAFRVHGPGPEADAGLATARSHNRYVPRFLKDRAWLSAPEVEFRPGQYGDAKKIVSVFHPFWDATPGALEWLDSAKAGKKKHAADARAPKGRKPRRGK